MLLDFEIPQHLTIIGYIESKFVNGIPILVQFNTTLSKQNKTEKKRGKKNNDHGHFYELLLDSLYKTKTSGIIKLQDKYALISSEVVKDKSTLILPIIDEQNVEWLKYQISDMTKNSIKDNFENSQLVKKDESMKIFQNSNLKQQYQSTEFLPLSPNLIQVFYSVSIKFLFDNTEKNIKNYDIIVNNIEKLRMIGNIYSISNMNELIITFLKSLRY